VGLIVGVSPDRVDEVLSVADGFVVGELIPGDRRVDLEGEPRW